MSDERIRELINSIETNSLAPTIAPQVKCSLCQDRKWVWVDNNRVARCNICFYDTVHDRVSKFIVAADIPEHFANFSLGTYPGNGDQNAWKKVSAWAEHGGDSSIYMYGNIGLGKTGLAVAALKYRIKETSVRGLFINYADFLHKLRMAMNNNNSDALLEEVLTVPLLVVDDLGASSPSPWRDEIGYILFGTRHDTRLPTIYTANMSLSKLVNSESIDVRAAARINEACFNPNGEKWIISMEGNNLRP
jgi:DNA replication protein DnaC